MSQIPVSGVTYSKLNVLKTKSILYKQGISFTWNDIIEAMIEVANKHEQDFYSEISKQNGKRKRNTKTY